MTERTDVRTYSFLPRLIRVQVVSKAPASATDQPVPFLHSGKCAVIGPMLHSASTFELRAGCALREKVFNDNSDKLPRVAFGLGGASLGRTFIKNSIRL